MKRLNTKYFLAYFLPFFMAVLSTSCDSLKEDKTVHTVDLYVGQSVNVINNDISLHYDSASSFWTSGLRMVNQGTVTLLDPEQITIDTSILPDDKKVGNNGAGIQGFTLNNFDFPYVNAERGFILETKTGTSKQTYKFVFEPRQNDNKKLLRIYYQRQ